MPLRFELTPEEYKDGVAALLAEKCVDRGTVERDARLPSGSGGRDRQIDVLVRLRLPEMDDGLMIVDCKRYGAKVDVKDVEAFIGMVEDVGAAMGLLLVTTEGYTSDADTRASACEHRSNMNYSTPQQRSPESRNATPPKPGHCEASTETGQPQPYRSGRFGPHAWLTEDGVKAELDTRQVILSACAARTDSAQHLVSVASERGAEPREQRSSRELCDRRDECRILPLHRRQLIAFLVPHRRASGLTLRDSGTQRRRAVHPPKSQKESTLVDDRDCNPEPLFPRAFVCSGDDGLRLIQR